jgi:hypothetical protein
VIVGDLLVQIGIKGASKVGDALTGIGKGMSEVSSLSLESKAAILGVVYGVEHFMSASAQMGMSLKQFSDYTHISTTELQKWQYAGRQAGVSAEEVTGSIEGIQSTIAKIQMGKGPTGGFGAIAAFTGGFDYGKINDTLYVLNKVKAFAQNTRVPIPFANEWLKEAGFGKNMVQFLRTTKLDLDKIKPSEIFGNNEVKRLADISVAWANLHRTFEMTTGHLTSKYGMDIVSGLTGAIKTIGALTDNIFKLTKSFPPLKDAIIAIGAVMAVSFAPVTAALTAIVYVLGEIQKYRDKKVSIFGDKGVLPEPLKMSEHLMQYLTGNQVGKDVGNLWDKISGKNPTDKKSGPSFVGNLLDKLGVGNSVAPTTDKKFSGPVPAGVQINQNITHYGDAKDTKSVKDVHKSSAQAAHYYRSSPAQLQVN